MAKLYIHKIFITTDGYFIDIRYFLQLDDYVIYRRYLL